MEIEKEYEKNVRPELGKMLRLLKLNKAFERAEGDRLFYKDGEKEKFVWDFLGGYGTTILGHNHPRLAQVLMHLIESRTPFAAQASVRPQTVFLAAKLNELIKKHTGEDRHFYLTCTNSGAEAVEAALKHALFDWVTRTDALCRATALKESVEPVILAVKGSFHGKTAASVSVTANEAFRPMYGKGAFEVVFIDPADFQKSDKNSIESFIASFDVKDKSGRRLFSRLAGFIFEPIQGEGGIVEIPSDFLLQMGALLKERRVPVIADEIQSGLFRTGLFLASAISGVKPDYILLGKSLGGGVSKIGAVLIAEDRYQKQFGWIHTSTFAEDDWSARLAVETLNLLDSFSQEIKERAEQFSHWFFSWAEAIGKKHPGLIKQARGRGFFLGLEFNNDNDSPMTEIFNGLHESGHGSYVYSGYLLNRHGLRVGATLSAKYTLRFEPSAFVVPQAIEALELGLNDLCTILAERKILKLMAPMWDHAFSAEQLETRSPKKPLRIGSKPGLRRVGFIAHVIKPDHAAIFDSSFQQVPRDKFENFLKEYESQARPFKYHEQIVEGKNGEKVLASVYGLMLMSSYFENCLRTENPEALQRVQGLLDCALDDGCELVGLGQYTSIVSNNGLLLDSRGKALTTGNSLTAGLSVRGVEYALKQAGRDLNSMKVGVLGFTGNICHVISQILGDQAAAMTLVHREPYRPDRPDDKFHKAVESLLAHSKVEKNQLTLSHEVRDLRDCDVVVVGTNSAQELVGSEHLKKGAVVLDLSVPSNVRDDVRKNSDFTYFQAGLARFHRCQVCRHHWFPLPPGTWYACLSETLTLGLNGVDQSFALGKLTKQSVEQALKYAENIGVGLGGFRFEGARANTIEAPTAEMI